MVKKVKRFVVFILFSIFFQLIHNKIAGTNEDNSFRLIPSAKALCCPPETEYVKDGKCCTKDSCKGSRSGDGEGETPWQPPKCDPSNEDCDVYGY